MNGKLNRIFPGIVQLLLVGSAMLTSIGVSFFCILGISGIFLHIPSGFLNSTHSQITADYYRLVGYLIGIQRRLFLHVIPVSFSGREHFADVQFMVHVGFMMTVIVIAIFLMCYRYEKQRNQLWEVVPLFKQCLSVLIVIAVMIVVSFQDSFLWFHYHFFRNMTWVFTVSKDPIIVILNLHFSLKFFVTWFILSLGLDWLILVRFKH